jgi:hypothetical protein
LEMSRPEDQADEELGEELFVVYRASIEDPPYNATDRALLRAAAHNDTCHWPRRTVYAALMLFVIALGLVLSLAIPPSQLLHQEQSSRAQTTPDDQYQISTMLGSANARDDIQQATLTLQLEADSQYATLALQAEAIQPSLYAFYNATMELADRALRVRPIPSAVRR